MVTGIPSGPDSLTPVVRSGSEALRADVSAIVSRQVSDRQGNLAQLTHQPRVGVVSELTAHYYRLHQAVTGARWFAAKVVSSSLDLLCPGTQRGETIAE